MAVKRLSEGYPDGIVLGNSSTDLVGFFGKTARVQGTVVVSIAATATTAILKNRINAINTRLKALGLLASA